MNNKLQLIKENKKSNIYENDEYTVKISDINGYFLKRNEFQYTDYDYNKGPDDYNFVEAVNLEVTSKITGKTAQKRCYQGYSVINEFQEDINNKEQFKTIFNKIDK